MTLGQTLFGFDGRLPRLSYFMFMIASQFVAILTTVFASSIMAADETGLLLGGVIAIIVFAGSVWVSLALTVKRLHDMDFSGFFIVWIAVYNIGVAALLVAAPSFGALAGLGSLFIGLWLQFGPGTAGPNKFDMAPIGSRMRGARGY